MTNGWIKRFADGTIEYGHDHIVDKKLASWRKGRLDNIVFSEVSFNSFSIAIEGPGEYWQSDDYIAPMSSLSPILICRRIQKKIENIDKWIQIWYIKNRLLAYISSSTVVFKSGGGNIMPLDQYKGKWLTLELDIRTSKESYSFKDERI